MNYRHEITDAQWERLAPLLPPQWTGKRGRPSHHHRRILNGIVWILRTGAPWRDLPERYGPWQTVYCRFRRWQQAGRWAQILHTLQEQGPLDWSAHFVDGTVIRAHQHAAGARREKGGPVSKR